MPEGIVCSLLPFEFNPLVHRQITADTSHDIAIQQLFLVSSPQDGRLFTSSLLKCSQVSQPETHSSERL
jgi:hypothetical protein